MRKDFLIEDKMPGGEAAFKLLQEATRIGGFVVGSGGVVPVERVLPGARFAHQPVFLTQIEEAPTKKTYDYYHWRGYIIAGSGLQETSGAVDYKKYKMLRVEYPRWYMDQTVARWQTKHPSLDFQYLLNQASTAGGQEELEKKFLEGSGLTTNEKFAMKLYFLNANNFSGVQLNVPTGRVWWATRVKLWSGILRNGLTVKQAEVVQDIPQMQNVQGRYHHVLRVFVWKAEGVYKMLAEEQVITMSGIPRIFIEGQYMDTNANFRVLLNEYVSQDSVNWQFSRTYAEDATEDPVKERRFRGYEGNTVLWEYLYKTAVYRHYQEGTPTNLPVSFDRPGGRHWRIRKAKTGGPLEAWASILGIALHKYLSQDGINWQFQWSKSFNKGVPM